MNTITDFDYTLRASGRTNGTIAQVRRTIEIAVTQPRGW